MQRKVDVILVPSPYIPARQEILPFLDLNPVAYLFYEVHLRNLRTENTLYSKHLSSDFRPT